MRNRCSVILAVVMVLGSIRLGAQAPRHLALALSSSPSLAVLWHTGAHFALRPDLAYSHSTTRSTLSGPSSNELTSSTNSSSVVAGLSALFFGNGVDSLHPYVVPRVSYTWNSGSSIESSNSLAASMGFGLQFFLGRRLATFGEVGAEYRHATQKAETLGTTAKSTTNSVSLRSLVGLQLYLR